MKSTVPPGVDFSGCKIVVDCGNGAAYRIAPLIFRELGAHVRAIGNNPDGKNINVGCGSLLPEKMSRKTLSSKAFCGMSFDGDADRVIFSDENGRILDGDDLISIAAPYMLSNARLKNRKVVLTLMSNCALVKYLNDFGISVRQVPVGDKNVTDALEKEDLILGGESSGHLIFREFAPTGDGILTAVQILSIVRALKKPFSYFAGRWKRFPQFVCSIKVDKKPALEKITGFLEKIDYLENKLKGNGRIFVRYSGTEPLLRILVEAESKVLTKKIAQDIVTHYKKHAGAKKGDKEQRDKER
jgi:phosphoglucosamine mutase